MLRWFIGIFVLIGTFLIIISVMLWQPRQNSEGVYWLMAIRADGAHRTLVRMNSDGANPTELPHTIEQGWSPQWSPNGRYISYVSGIFYDLYRLDYEGRHLRTLSTCFAQEQAPAWSPDGTKIAFVSNCRDTNLNLYVMDADGSNRQQLTTSSTVDNAPRWSPDGKWIIYQANRAGGNNINLYRIRPDGTERETPHQYPFCSVTRIFT